jgi:hypothetical protein
MAKKRLQRGSEKIVHFFEWQGRRWRFETIVSFNDEFYIEQSKLYQIDVLGRRVPRRNKTR